MTMTTVMAIVQCACAAVVLELRGDPIGCVACYCDTCQEGSRRIEALPDAATVREPDGGTAYVVYRKDRVAYANGKELLIDDRLEGSPKTNRVIASCCNSAMLMRFDDARHWIPVYRERLGANAPPVEMRICTGDMPENAAISSDIPSFRSYAPPFLMKLLSARFAMLLGSWDLLVTGRRRIC